MTNSLSLIARFRFTRLMPARRGRKKTRRRRDTRINLLSIVEGAIYGSIITQAAFATNVVSFFTDGPGAEGVSLRELFSNPAASFDVAQRRLTNPDIILGAAVKSLTVGVLFNLFTKTLSKPRRKVNASLKMLGVPVKM
jgi:hypothetical protein